MPVAVDYGVESVVDVVTDLFGLDIKSTNFDEARIFCPVHEKDEENHNPSADVNLDTGLWSCFSCGASGDIANLGMAVLDKSYMEMVDALRPGNTDALTAMVRAKVRRKMSEAKPKTEVDEPRKNDVPPLGAYSDGPLDAMIARGFDPEHLSSWGVRFVDRLSLAKPNTASDNFEITNSIAIPIVGRDGEVASWVYRATNKSADWQKNNAKYIYTPGLSNVLNKTWFGLHRHKDKKVIVVVEGSLDAIWLDQCGIPAVAMLGTNSKQFEKVDALTTFSKVIIFPDKDMPGVNAAVKLGDRLQSLGVPVRIGLYRDWMTARDGKPACDPQDLSRFDAEFMLEESLAWPVWRRKIKIAPTTTASRNGKQNERGVKRGRFGQMGRG